MTSLDHFALLGGPLHRFASRMRLVRDGTDTVRLGLSLGLLTWGILVLLTLAVGVGDRLFTLSAIGVHVRLMVAIPLFFLCETWVFPRMTEFVREIVRSGLVPDSALPKLATDVRRIGRLGDSWLAEAVFAVVAFALPMVEAVTFVPGRTANWSSLLAQTEATLGPVLCWYLGFCLPLFRFLLLRWLWRLGLWSCFLWRLQKLGLRLIPTHPDGAGGLGFLEVVQEHFAPLAVAISAVVAAGVAEDIVSGTVAFEAVYRVAPLVLFLIALLFIGPLFLFSPALWACRVNGWNNYMAMASRYVDAFDRKWVRDESVTGASQLGTADLQSLADLGNSVSIVQGMRWLPASRRLVTGLAAAGIVPMLPLLLFQYPMADLATRLLTALTGL